MVMENYANIDIFCPFVGGGRAVAARKVLKAFLKKDTVGWILFLTEADLAICTLFTGPFDHLVAVVT